MTMDIVIPEWAIIALYCFWGVHLVLWIVQMALGWLTKKLERELASFQETFGGGPRHG